MGCSPWGREDLDTTEQLHFHALEKEMATHSSVLAWRISWTEELGRYSLWGCKELDTTEQLTNTIHIHIVYMSFYLVGHSRCLPPLGKVRGTDGGRHRGLDIGCGLVERY